MADAITGQTSTTMTIDNPPTQYQIEAGYSPGGTFMFNLTTATPAATDPLRFPVDIVRSVRVRNGRMEFLDQAGQAILGTAGGQGPELQTALGADAADGALQLVDGVVLTTLPATGAKTGYDGSTTTVTSISQTGDLATVMAQLSAVEPGAPPLTQRRIYRQIGSNYVLQEARTDISSASSGMQVAGTATVRFANVTWSRNSVQDQARASGVSTNTWTDGSTSNLLPYIPPGCEPGTESCEPPNTGGGGGGSSSGCALTPGGANIVYQHGILSNASTWGDPETAAKIRGRARCGLQIGFDAAFTQANSGFGPHDEQATFLQNKITLPSTQPLVPNQLILVGHSQGGLISRRVAQSLWNPGAGPDNRIRGVVTIGTPHLGANIARNLAASGLNTAIGLFDNGVTCRIIGSSSCFNTRSSLTVLANGFLSIPGSTDAMRDLVPGSQAMGITNGGTENFPRYGIRHLIPTRWAFARVGGDFFRTDGGPTAVDAMRIVFAGAIAGGIIATIVTIWNPGAWAFAAALYRAAYELDRADRWYNRVTAGSDFTDGIVEGASQIYPGLAPQFNFRAADPTSHLGETNTRKSYDPLESVLVGELSVVRRP